MEGGRTGYMPVLRALDARECRHIDTLQRLSGVPRKRMVRVLGCLLAGGYALRRAVGCYLLAPEGARRLAAGGAIRSGPRGPHTGRRKPSRARTVRDKVWAALRIKVKTSIPELIEAAGVDQGAYSNVQRYIAALHRAGHLHLLAGRAPGSAPTSNGHKRFMLVRDLGPVAPRVLANGDVHDGNERAEGERPSRPVATSRDSAQGATGQREGRQKTTRAQSDGGQQKSGRVRRRP